MPRLLGPAILFAGSFLGPIAGAQATVAGTSVASSVNSAPPGMAITLTARVAPQATAAANGSEFNSTPFNTYFGFPIDPSFTNVTGQVTADFNNDGAPDLLVYGIDNTDSTPNPLKVQSFVSNGKGAFTAGIPQELTLPAASANVAVVPTLPAIDVNGDGKLDLLIGTAVAYGNGDGSFQQPVTPTFLSSGFSGTYAADVTGDGKPDILAVNAIPVASLGQSANIPLQVTVLENQGGGNFQALGAYTLGTGQYSLSVTLASLSFVDLNGDGKLDLVAQMYFLGFGNAEVPASLAVLLNHGDGTFDIAQPVSYPAQQNGGSIELLSLQAADFNGDSKVDLALVYPPPYQTSLTYLSQIIFLPGNGDGTFGTAINSTVSTMVEAGTTSAQPPAGNAVVIDADANGALDLVFGSGTVALGDNKGDFSMGTPIVKVSIPGLPTAINYTNTASLGIFQPTGSAYPDLVFAAPSGAGSAPFPLVAVSAASPFSVLSGDGSPTVTVTSGQSVTVSLNLEGAAGYVGSVTLTCAGLPAGAACNFTPSTLAVSEGKPQTSMLTVSTTAGKVAGRDGPLLRTGLATLCGVFSGSLLLLWPKRLRASWIILAVVSFALLPLGCGGNSTSSNSPLAGTPAGTYTFQVIGTAGSTKTSTAFTLIVQ